MERFLWEDMCVTLWDVLSYLIKLDICKGHQETILIQEC